MKINLTPTELIDQLRAWFFPKDRSIYLADSCYIYLPGSYQLAMARIAETTLAVAAASITFSAIPQIFRHLFLVCQMRTDRVDELDGVTLQFNGDTGINYDYLIVSHTTAGTGISAGRAVDHINIAQVEADNSRASNFGLFTVMIPSYTLTNREKWAHSSNSGAFGNVSADTDLNISTRRGRWRSTVAISSLTLAPLIGANFAVGTVVTLYGMM